MQKVMRRCLTGFVFCSSIFALLPKALACDEGGDPGSGCTVTVTGSRGGLGSGQPGGGGAGGPEGRPGISPYRAAPDDPVQVAIGVTLDSVDDLQCVTDEGAKQLNKDPDSLRAAGRVTSQSSPEDRQEAARLLTDIARLQGTLGSMIIGKGKINPTDTFDTGIAGIVFADGGMERYYLIPMVTTRVRPVDGVPIKMGDGVPKTASCAKG